MGIGAFRAAVEGVFGGLTPLAFAAQTFGLYAGLVYFTPLIGGWLGDRALGRTRAVAIGAAVIVAGHLLMAVEAALLPALGLLFVGCRLLKGNLAAQVGALYALDDVRRDRAFSIYYVGVKLGAFTAPLVCGTLGELAGWHYGFAARSGMAVGLAGRRHLPPPPDTRIAADARTRLTPDERRAVSALLLILALVALFWVAQTQVWNSYAVWVRDRLDRRLLGHDVPVTWFQSIDALTVLLLAPPLLAFWRRRDERGRGSDDLAKLAIGCAIFGAACLWLVVGEALAGGGGRVAIFWPILFHLTCALGYLHVVPIGLALFARTAPAPVNALMVSVYYLAIFAALMAGGWIARFYEVLPPAAFWTIHAATVGMAGVAITVLRTPLSRALSLHTERSDHAQL